MLRACGGCHQLCSTSGRPSSAGTQLRHSSSLHQRWQGTPWQLRTPVHRSARNLYEEALRDLLPNGEANTPVRRLSYRLETALTLEELANLATLEGRTQNWLPRHLAATLTQMAKLTYFKAIARDLRQRRELWVCLQRLERGGLILHDSPGIRLLESVALVQLLIACGRMSVRPGPVALSALLRELLRDSAVKLKQAAEDPDLFCELVAVLPGLLKGRSEGAVRARPPPSHPAEDAAGRTGDGTDGGTDVHSGFSPDGGRTGADDRPMPAEQRSGRSSYGSPSSYRSRTSGGTAAVHPRPGAPPPRGSPYVGWEDGSEAAEKTTALLWTWLRMLTLTLLSRRGNNITSYDLSRLSHGLAAAGVTHTPLWDMLAEAALTPPPAPKRAALRAAPAATTLPFMRSFLEDNPDTSVWPEEVGEGRRDSGLAEPVSPTNSFASGGAPSTFATPSPPPLAPPTSSSSSSFFSSTPTSASPTASARSAQSAEELPGLQPLHQRARIPRDAAEIADMAAAFAAVSAVTGEGRPQVMAALCVAFSAALDAPALPPAAVVRMVSALALADYRNEKLLTRVADLVAGPLDELGRTDRDGGWEPLSLSMVDSVALASAYARVRVYNRALFNRLAGVFVRGDVLGEQGTHVTPHNKHLTTMARAFGEVEHLNKKLFAYIGRLGLPRVDELSAGQLVDLVVGFATVRVHNDALAEAACTAAVRGVRQLSATQASQLVWAFQTMGYRAESLALIGAMSAAAPPPPLPDNIPLFWTAGTRPSLRSSQGPGGATGGGGQGKTLGPYARGHATR